MSADTTEQYKAMMARVESGAIQWVNELFDDDSLRLYLVGLPVNEELLALDRLAYIEPFQIAGTVEFFITEQLRKEQNGAQNRLVVNLENIAAAQASASNSAANSAGGLHTPDLDAAFRHGSTSTEGDPQSPDWRRPSIPLPQQPGNSPHVGSGEDMPQMPPLPPRMRPDVNSETRAESLRAAVEAARAYVRRTAKQKETHVLNSGADCIRMSLDQLQTAFERGEMGSKECFDWVRLLDKEEE